MLRIEAGERRRVRLTVNGRARQGLAEPRTSLADFLRHELGLYGTRVGCEHGVCGACTVIVDGCATRSCLNLAVQAEGAAVRTVEGLAAGGALAPLQAAFRARHALQCGYCTAGVLMSATRFLETCADPDEEAVREMLSGHICRCTGYEGMVRAILDVAGREGAEGSAP